MAITQSTTRYEIAPLPIVDAYVILDNETLMDGLPSIVVPIAVPIRVPITPANGAINQLDWTSAYYLCANLNGTLPEMK